MVESVVHSSEHAKKREWQAGLKLRAARTEMLK